MQSYYWVKTFHIVFVVAWMATVFYLPRILVNLAETVGQPAVTERLQLMVLVPGTTLLVTSLPAVRPSPAESGMQPVLESEPPGSTLKGN